MLSKTVFNSAHAVKPLVLPNLFVGIPCAWASAIAVVFLTKA